VPFKSDAERVIVDHTVGATASAEQPYEFEMAGPREKISTLRSQPLPLFPRVFGSASTLRHFRRYTDAFGDFTLKTTWIGLDRPGQFAASLHDLVLGFEIVLDLF
jgi:hypothetical protein